MKRRLILYAVLLALISFNLRAQESVQNNKKRPKVGVALSGGGAKGLAHIGVIEAMEKAGLRPDYITGTSMGSLVGALWAIGYDSQQMTELVDSLNWDVILSNAIPMKEVVIEEKPYYGRFIVELPFENKGLSLPKGLIEGQKLNEIFAYLTRPVHGIDDFNDFPIPYKAIAADITTGKQVEISSGFLPEAMRASMAIPSIFTPVEKDSMVLVDGGIVRNFPVQNVIDMGADIVIGIYVSSDLKAKVEVSNMVDILAESAFIAGTEDSRAQKKLVDIYVAPNLKGYTSADFNASDSIISRGREAGNEFYGIFKNLADSLNSLGTQEEIPPPVLQKNYLISEVTFEGYENFDLESLYKKLNIKAGDSISAQELENKIDLLYGTRRFKSIGYSLDPTEGDKGYHLRLEIKEAARGNLKLSAHYDSENLAGINGNFTLLNFLLPQSRAIVEVDLAQNPYADVNYLKYIGNSLRYALSIGFTGELHDLPVYDEDFVAATFRNTYQRYYLRFQRTSSQRFTYGFDFFYENSVFKPKVGELANTAIDKIRNRNLGIQPFFRVNTINKRYFPTKGSIAEIRYTYNYWNDNLIEGLIMNPVEVDGFMDLRLDWIYFGRILGDKLSWFTRNTIWVSNLPSESINLTDFSFIGGFIPRFDKSYEYWGGEVNEFPVNNYFYSQWGLQWQIIPKLFLQGVINYIDVEYPRAFFESDPDIILLGTEKRRFGFGGGIGYNTPIGPVQVNVAKDIYKKNAVATFIIGFYY